MRRPWYAYLLLALGGIALLGALTQPVVGAIGPPGALLGPDGRLTVLQGTPLERAGVRTGDRFTDGETVQAVARRSGQGAELRWNHGIPRSGRVRIVREGKPLVLEVRPRPGAWPVRLAWWLLGFLNLGLTALALALFWQRPRDGRAALLGLVLLSAPVFAVPREPRLLALALAAHFFTLFPPDPAGRRRRPWRTALAIYLPFLFLSAVGSNLWSGGHVPAAAALFDTIAVVYAGYGLGRVLLRSREASEGERPVLRTLAVAAGAILAAALLAIPQRLWVVSDQFVPANLLAAVLFSAAVGHLVFRLRALEVRLTARRTLQYLLARWTLGTLFLIPGFLLVWRFGQLSAMHQQGRPQDAVPYLLWMLLAALLLRKRQQVLRNLDRRFFQDVEAARQSLIRLAQELGAQTEAGEVLSTLEAGVRGALHPSWLRFALPDAPGPGDEDLAVPIHRGTSLLGYLQLGARDNGQGYSPEERGLLEAAAVQAATALENARLSAALLARQRDELAARTAGVLAGAEEERRRLAADLHDEVLPELRSIAAEVERLKGRANGSAPELERLESDIRQTMDGVREVMEALRPSALDMLGLTDALESCFRRAAARRDPPLSVSVRRSGAEPCLPPEQSLALYRICQEAINNVIKHSGATHAGLDVSSDGDSVTLIVWDDGRGFEPGHASSGGRGLGNIRYRVDLIGAAVSWTRPPEGGTRVEVSLAKSSGQPSAVSGQ